MKWSYKEQHLVPRARNDADTKVVRRQYSDDVSQLTNRALLFCDETGLNLHSSVRGYFEASFGWVL